MRAAAIRLGASPCGTAQCEAEQHEDQAAGDHDTEIHAGERQGRLCRRGGGGDMRRGSHVRRCGLHLRVGLAGRSTVHGDERSTALGRERGGEIEREREIGLLRGGALRGARGGAQLQLPSAEAPQLARLAKPA